MNAREEEKMGFLKKKSTTKVIMKRKNVETVYPDS